MPAPNASASELAGKNPLDPERPDEEGADTGDSDFRLGLVYSLIINALFALGVIAIFYANRVPQWLWVLFIVKQLLAIPIYVAMDFTLGNLGKVNKAMTVASVLLIVGLVLLQIILKSVVVHYSAQYTRIPAWVWSFSSFAGIILVLLSSLGKYQEKIAATMDVPLPSVSMAVRAGILANLALYSASTIALAVYGKQSWTTGIFVLVVIIQLGYAFKSYLLPDSVVNKAKELRDKIRT